MAAWKIHPLYDTGEVASGESIRDPSLPTECPKCGASLWWEGLNLYRNICQVCGHDLIIARVRAERLAREAADRVDLDDYDDRYDARSGMRGLIDWSESFAMDR